MYILSSVRFVTRPIISGSIELQINKSVILSCWCGWVFGFAPIFYDWCVKGWTFTQNKRMTFLNMYKTLNFKSILKKYIQDLSPPPLPPPPKKFGCEGFSQGIPNLRQLKYWYNTDSLVCIGLYSGYTHLSHLKAWHSVQHKDKKSWEWGI